jgi:hypothetical protein
VLPWIEERQVHPVVPISRWRRPAAGAAALALAVLGLGCLAHRGPPAGRGASDLTGTWDWVIEEQNEDGDTRVEREEWHLTQQGKELRGFYDRVLTVRSGDGRPFECYRDTRYQKFTRFRVTGVVDGAQVTLREIEFETPPDPCDRGQRRMTTYVGRLDGQTLTLRWQPSGMQVLRRRRGALAAVAAPPPPATPPAAAPDPGPPSGNASGVWVWDWRAIDADGDERIEHEEWRLRQRGRSLQGEVERTVRLVRGSGAAWACSGTPVQTVVTRREVTGSIAGQHVALTETSARQTAGAPCPPEARPLFRYEGELGVEELSLARGFGLRPDRRILRRVRPLAGAL